MSYKSCHRLQLHYHSFLFANINPPSHSYFTYHIYIIIIYIYINLSVIPQSTSHGLSSLLSPGGDHSDEFSFVAMFPSALRPVTVPFTTAFNNLFVLLGIFPDIESDIDKLRSQLNPHHLKYHNATTKVTVEDVVGAEAENQAADALQVTYQHVNIILFNTFCTNPVFITKEILFKRNLTISFQRRLYLYSIVGETPR
jgi:hypothetical protein